MSHNHSISPAAQLNNAFFWGIVLNLAFVAVEFFAGFYTQSLALLSDAGHNISDVATLALSLLAFRLARQRPSERYTYGFHRGTILASLANAIILLIALGAIGWEAVQRFRHPAPTNGLIISLVAAFGIGINGLSALLFFRSKEQDLNAKGAYLHLALDAAVSLGVVASGLLIRFTGLEWIDPLTSLIVISFVIYSSWGLLKESLRLALDGVPQKISIGRLKSEILTIKGIREIYHIHVWAMGTSTNAMTAHLVMEEQLSSAQVGEIKERVRHKARELNIHHVTLETENRMTGAQNCAL